jgi:hypothetical protein
MLIPAHSASKDIDRTLSPWGVEVFSSDFGQNEQILNNTYAAGISIVHLQRGSLI